jgi:hypothetical protein
MAGLRENLEVCIALRNPCNYNCFYCAGEDKSQNEKILYHDLNKIARVYSDASAFIVTSFECGAGEPSRHPQIKDLISIASQYGMLAIPSNNSTDPKDWIDPLNAKRIVLRASLHPQAIVEIDKFKDRLLVVQDMGATVRVEYVAHPQRLKEVKKYTEYFEKFNIPFFVVPFNGIYQDKNYPNFYTEVERNEAFGKNKEYEITWYQKLVLDMPSRDFCGLSCLAGYSYLFIDKETKFLRCLYDTKNIEELLKEPLPCSVNCCGCGLYLKDLNTQDIPFWNFYRSLAGEPLLPDPEEDKSFEAKKKIFDKLLSGRAIKLNPVFNKFRCAEGLVPEGDLMDFVGIRTKTKYNLLGYQSLQSNYVQTSYPTPDENYFEWIDVLESVVNSGNTFVMAELGAGWGRWLSVAFASLKQLFPLKDYRLIGVEAEKTHFEWLREHLLYNGVDPVKMCLYEAAVTESMGTVNFIMGDPGRWYGQCVQGSGIPVQSITLDYLLSSYEKIDLIDLDIQGKEYEVLSSGVKILEKTKRVHIGTHSKEIEVNLRNLFNSLGWKSCFDFSLLGKSETPYGPVDFQDGIQSWVNPRA